MPKFVSYLDQLREAAVFHNVDLKEAVVAAGLGDCTYYRWVGNITTPNETKARQVFATIHDMSSANG